MGAQDSIEQQLCAQENIQFEIIKVGKYDRTKKYTVLASAYKNIVGITQSYFIMKKYRIAGVFVSGGFVSFPVVVGARLVGASKIVLHACDRTLGLANSMCRPFATHISCTFRETCNAYPKNETIFSGPIIDYPKHKKKIEMDQKKPTLLIYGGSQGAVTINQHVRDNIDSLTNVFNVTHVCGQGNTDESFNTVQGYTQHGYVHGMEQILQNTDVAIARAGSNSLWELILYQIPHVAIPLPATVSRGDQQENAQYFADQGVTRWMNQEEFLQTDIASLMQEIYRDRKETIEKMKYFAPKEPASEIISRLLTE